MFVNATNPDERYFTWQVPNGIIGWTLPVTISPSPMGVLLVESNWSSTYEWTQVVLDSGGANTALCFFTPYPPETNITTSLNAGNVKMTIGKAFTQSTSDFWSYATWFLGLISGIQTYGLPEMFVWLLRILTAIGFLSFVLLAREFIPLLP